MDIWTSMRHTVWRYFEIESSSKYTVSQKDGLKTEKTVFLFLQKMALTRHMWDRLFSNLIRNNGYNFIEGQFDFEVRSLLKLAVMECPLSTMTPPKILRLYKS